MELMRASNQWATRPADERFGTVDELHAACLDMRRSAATSEVMAHDLRYEADGGEVVMLGSNGGRARFTNWAFGQQCASVGAPASYLRNLPPQLAADCLNQSTQQSENKTRCLLLHRNGGFLLRGATSPVYDRLWNHEVTERMLGLVSEDGWAVPPTWPVAAGTDGARLANAAEIENSRRLHAAGASMVALREGNHIVPSGLYASAHDLFAFLILPARPIERPGELPLHRGVFFENSETGAKKIKGTSFVFDTICGNHIVWGAKDVFEVGFRHVGDIRSKWGNVLAELRAYADDSTNEQEAQLLSAMEMEIGTSKEEVLDFLFSKQFLTRKQSVQTVELAEQYGEERGFNPRSVYGLVQGATYMARDIPFADERVKVERAAGKILEVAF